MNRHQRRANNKRDELLGRFAASASSYLSVTDYKITEAERTVATRLTRHAQTLRLKGVPFYHGGHAGREVGDLLRPSSETGVVREAIATVHDRVFVTSSLMTARSYAAQAGGVVYRVEPLGEFDVDIASVRTSLADQRGTRGGSRSVNAAKTQVTQFRCEAARVVEVLEGTERD